MWAEVVLSLGTLTGITSVLLVLMLSQPRVWLAMARDGLVPQSFFGAVHERYRTPWKSTILTGVIVAVAGSLLPLRLLADLTNIGTLFAFVVVCAAVLIMRRTHPEAERPFRAPFSPVTPILGILICLLLMFSLPPENWALVTSARPELARARMGAAGLPMPEIVVTSNDVIQGKPHPDCFLKALERLDVSACDAIVFEDAAAGLAAGRAAGCRIVALATTSEAERLEPEDWVYDFERIELLEVQSDGKLLLRFN